jgi:RNA polymerase sigma-70 factor (ECF subfamily)
MQSEKSELTIQQLVAEYHGPVYGYAYRLSGSHADADDLSQQVFLIAQQKIGQVRDADRVKSWLFTVLRNLYLKDLQRRKPESWETERLEEQPDSSLADDPIDRQQIQIALDAIPPNHRTILLMYFFEEMPYREIAESMKIPIGTVMSRLSRAKQAFKAQLGEPE